MRLSAISARSACERRLGAGRERVGLCARAAVDLGAGAVGAPDQVGLDADDRIAAAHGAAFHRLEQEAHRPAAAELQKGRDRRLQVGDQRRPHDLRLAAGVAFGEGALRRLDLHDCGYWFGRAAADDLRQRGLVDRDADLVFQPREIFADNVVGVGRSAARSSSRLRVRRVGVELGIDDVGDA